MTVRLFAFATDVASESVTSSAEYVFTFGLTEALIDYLVLARKMQGVLIAGARRVETP